MKDGSKSSYKYFRNFSKLEFFNFFSKYISKDFAFYVEMGLAYKVMRDTFTESEICDITEIQLFPDQYIVGMLPKKSPMHDAISFG